MELLGTTQVGWLTKPHDLSDNEGDRVGFTSLNSTVGECFEQSSLLYCSVASLDIVDIDWTSCEYEQFYYICILISTADVHVVFIVLDWSAE